MELRKIDGRRVIVWLQKGREDFNGSGGDILSFVPLRFLWKTVAWAESLRC
jgi:hypothetical protein